jgi:uncharacterized protein involved in type VI secretion and phage assembly
MNDLRNLGVVFTSRALDADAVRVLDIAGREQLGQLFEFRVRFALETGPLADAEIDQLLQSPCSFTLGVGADDVVHGVVREIDLVADVEGRQTVYVAREQRLPGHDRHRDGHGDPDELRSVERT